MRKRFSQQGQQGSANPGTNQSHYGYNTQEAWAQYARQYAQQSQMAQQNQAAINKK